MPQQRQKVLAMAPSTRDPLPGLERISLLRGKNSHSEFPTNKPNGDASASHCRRTGNSIFFCRAASHRMQAQQPLKGDKDAFVHHLCLIFPFRRKGNGR